MGSVGIMCPDDSKKEKLIRELTEGQDSALKLFTLFRKPVSEDGLSDLAGELLVKILGCFDQGLCLVGCSDRVGENVLNSCVLEHHQDSAFSPDNVMEESEDSSGTKKRANACLKDRRGCYKRRKSSQTWITVKPTMEDGQAWRKYGQKVILNAKYPRSYFRCTHKYDQDCKAAKQVQMMEDNPGMYQTTYIGTHTCNRDQIKPPQLIVPDYSQPGSSSFNIVFPEHIKTEEKDQVDTKSDLTVDNVSFSSLQDNTSSFLQTDHLMAGFEFSSSHQEDIARMYRLGVEDDGAHSEMELLVRGGFHGDFHFDDKEFS
ncbi:WRKY DNA-binding transcription factor 70-like [Punica granatum]|uniref:WRKY DNA-binding transcription factor 70-like n=1 Tax=Punica granatum TaxID=22663 RepID=A0A218XQ49_PUNGR|nr:WRKY DNA-binding transcription factor 70-like [Punica granatum]OWM87335.1 hypothetical protein CDL15_Pgr022446 [Punica granatum]